MRRLIWVFARRICIIIENALWKHAYSYIMKLLPPKNENFQIKNSDIFHISAQNIDCGYSLEPLRRGGSSEYRQDVFEQKKNNLYPCKPQFYYIKVGFNGSKLYMHVFVMLNFKSFYIWASARQNLQQDLCNQQRLRLACISTKYSKGSPSSLFR